MENRKQVRTISPEGDGPSKAKERKHYIKSYIKHVKRGNKTDSGY